MLTIAFILALVGSVLLAITKITDVAVYYFGQLRRPSERVRTISIALLVSSTPFAIVAFWRFVCR